jgi:predicted SprT family Zn-dependent metalloprotease
MWRCIDMPKIEKIGTNKYRYQCTCGQMVILESDVPPKRLSKCWECCEKLPEEYKDDAASVS